MIWWRTAGKQFPLLIAHGMEVIFNRTFQGLPLGLKSDTVHPFAEPGAQPVILGNRRHNRVQASRMRTLAVVEDTLLRASVWAKEERRAFADRVVNWEVHRGCNAATTDVSAVECPEPIDISDLAESDGGSDHDVMNDANTLDIDPKKKPVSSSACTGSDSESSSSESDSGSSSSECGSFDATRLLFAGANQYLMANQLDGQICGLSFLGGKVVVSTLETLRQRRLAETMAGNPSVVGTRRKILANAAHTFSSRWLLQDWSEVGTFPAIEERRPCLKILYDEFAPLLWGITPSVCPYKEPPPELFQHVSFLELWDQYQALSKFCRLVAHHAETHEGVASVYEKTHVKARYWDRLHRQWKVIIQPYSSIKMGSRRSEADGVSSRELVICKGWGEVEVLEYLSRPRDHLLFFAVMQVQYDVIHKRRLWHILRLWHRLYFFSFDVEAIDEHVASVARYIEKNMLLVAPWRLQT